MITNPTADNPLHNFKELIPLDIDKVLKNTYRRLFEDINNAYWVSDENCWYKIDINPKTDEIYEGPYPYNLYKDKYVSGMFHDSYYVIRKKISSIRSEQKKKKYLKRIFSDIKELQKVSSDAVISNALIELDKLLLNSYLYITEEIYSNKGYFKYAENDDDWNEDERDAIHSLYKKLKNYKYISNNTKWKDFKKAFTGEELSKGVRWLSSQIALHHFIIQLCDTAKPTIGAKWVISHYYFKMENGKDYNIQCLSSPGGPISKKAKKDFEDIFNHFSEQPIS